MAVRNLKRLLLLVPFLTGLPYGCEEPCGSSSGTSQFRITGFNTTVSSSSNRFSDHVIEANLVTEQAVLFEGPLQFSGYSVYACSPPPSIYTNDITSINIVSGSDYSNEYKAGTNLLDLCEIGQFPNKDFPLKLASPFLTFRLLSPPDVDGTFTFTIQIDLDDGRSFTDTAPTISITR